MKQQELTRNITIGLTDGLTIPFALAAGLSSVVSSPANIFTACIIVSIAGAITMSAGAFMEAKKYDPATRSFSAAMIIGISYVSGGFITSLPWLYGDDAFISLQYAFVINLLLLFIAGYFESRINGANAWAGAFRVMLTGAVAALAVYGVAKLFR